jgi:hypothetical protein
MANNVGNKLTIKCQDSDIMERIKKLILRNDKNNNQEFTMEILLPRSMAFADEEHYDLDWNKAIWGTKKDVMDYSIIYSGCTLTLIYNTAWEPNSGWVETLCCYLHHYLFGSPKKSTCNLEVEHRYSDYPGNFGGIVYWKPGIEFAYKHYESYMEYLRNHDSNAYDEMLEVEKSLKSESNSIRLISIPI